MSGRWKVVALGAMLGALCAAGAGCGGSPGDPGGGAGPELLAPSEADLDGWVTNVGSVNVDQGGPLTGDIDGLEPGLRLRQFFSFDLSDLPEGSTILAATLSLYLAETPHGDPFSTLGVVLVDHVAYGDTLTGAYYDSAPLSAGLGPLATEGMPGYRALDVTAQVQADVAAGRMHSQYRLRWSLMDGDDDGVDDFVAFTETEDSCCATGQLPILRIAYTPP